LAEVEQEGGETDRTKATQRVARALAEQFDGTKRNFDVIVDEAIKSDGLKQKVAMENTKALVKMMAKKVELVIESNSDSNFDTTAMNDISGMANHMQEDAESWINTNRANLEKVDSTSIVNSIDGKFDITSLKIHSDGTGDLSIVEVARVGRILGLIGYEPSENDVLFTVFRAVTSDLSILEFKSILKSKKVELDESTYQKLLALVDSGLIEESVETPVATPNSRVITAFSSEQIAGRIFYAVTAPTVMQIMKVDNIGSQITLGNPIFPANISDISEVQFSGMTSLDKSYFRVEFVTGENRFFNVYYPESEDAFKWFYDFETAKAYASKLSDTTVPDTETIVNIDIDNSLVSGKAFSTSYIDDSSVISETIHFYDNDTFYSEIKVNTAIDCTIKDGIWTIGGANSLAMNGTRVCPTDTRLNGEYSRVYIVHTIEGNDFQSLTSDGAYDIAFNLVGTALPIPKTGFERDDLTEIVTNYDNNLMYQDDESLDTQSKIHFWVTPGQDDYSNPNGPETILEYCTNLNLGAYNDWRIPIVSELDDIQGKFIIKHGSSGLFSTSESVDNDSNNRKAYGVNLGTGAKLDLLKTFGYNIRCVRNLP
jgi:hypothetical protein